MGKQRKRIWKKKEDNEKYFECVAYKIVFFHLTFI